MTDHARILAAGLLAGRLDTRGRSDWPAWAAKHVAACPECRAHLAADELLRRTVRLEAPPASRPRPPAPTVAQLRARPLPAAPPASDLASEYAPFPNHPYRGASLEIVRTSEGVRAWDPEAGHIAIFALDPTGRTRALAEASEPEPGVTASARLALEVPARVVAVSAREHLDAEMWRLWLEDQARASPEARLDARASGDRVHMAEYVFTARPAASRIRLRNEPLAAASAPIDAAFKAAASAGSEGREGEAAGRYRAGLQMAEAAEDRTGIVRGRIGLALALLGMGFNEDARQMLAEATEHLELDQRYAGVACRNLAWEAVLSGKLAEATAWRDEAAKVDATSPWRVPLDRAIALHDRQWSQVADAPSSAASASPLAERLLACQTATCLGLLGRAAEGRARLAEVPEGLGVLELTLWRAVADLLLSRAEGGHALSMKAVAAALGQEPVARLSLWQDWPLRFAVGLLIEDEPALAAELQEQRFFSGVSSEGQVRFTLAGTPFGLASTCGSGGRARRIAIDAPTLTGFVERLRQAVILGRSPEPDASVLAEVLFPGGRLPRGELVVASDGLLSGVPWPLLLDRVAPRDRVEVTEALGRKAGTPSSPTSRRVASLADPMGDLPFASRECASGEADIHLRGARATRRALEDVGEVGLLHLGFHVERYRGMPQLLLADGPLPVAELAHLTLRGHPVVLLSGCESGVRRTEAGLERSLADAFLRAGASAVVATRWPVSDAEGFELFRPLIAAWPFSRVETTLAGLISHLRENGRPPRLWAALAVYRA